MQITETQIAQVNKQIKALLSAESFYGKKLEEAGVTSIQSAEDFQKLPFSEKNDLRNAYPLGLMTAPEEKIVRIHSSSGTTGLPVIFPYTQPFLVLPHLMLFFLQKKSKNEGLKTRFILKKVSLVPNAGVKRCGNVLQRNLV